MAMPKYKISKTKSRMRRAAAYYGRMTVPALSTCDNCGSPKQPHRVCPECGFYKGKQILTKVVQEA